MADQLVEFFRDRKSHRSSPSIDWQVKKQLWINSVAKLYEFVEEMLSESVASEAVKLRRFDIEVTEQFIGTYSIAALELDAGGERVEFRPKGITIIGASGRVDIRGERDTVSLLKDQPDVNSGWTVVQQRVPNLITTPLDSESLKYSLERVMLPLL